MDIGKLILGILIATVLPWILVFALAFIVYFDPAVLSWIAATEGLDPIMQPITLFAILSFNVLAFTVNIPIFGTSFVLIMGIWAFTGFLVGVFTEDPKTSVLAVGIGLVVNIVIFLVSNGMALGIPPEAISDAIVALTSFNLIALMADPISALLAIPLMLAYVSVLGLILPSGLFGGMLGGILNRRIMEK